MNNKKSIWDELNDLPRNPNNEKQSWQKIEKKMKKPKSGVKVLSGFVTVAIVMLVFALLNSTQFTEKPLQGTVINPTLQAIFFINDTEYDEFKAKNSNYYTYIHKNDDQEQLGKLETYLEKMIKVDVPKPSAIYQNGIYSDVILKYDDGSEGKYKILQNKIGYLYNVDEKQWYFIETKDDMELATLDHILWQVLDDNQISSWVSIVILANAIISFVLERYLKRKYDLEKIVYGGENKIAKAIIYGCITLYGVFLISTILLQFIIHLYWILLVFIVTIAISFYIEKKYAQNNAALYLLICSSIGILMITILFSMNI
ncbi:hypothetical protein [Lysinibacillus antri]|uniref:DUF4181 domain-containing protein n=1 Tax=Lysinibacillus antri TaxID=2498145 RepID=A0A432LDQ9_9BACI|nr:hypothetical protein [Lysinibacillus antri]RUL53987.1 hypothetical protein EK386_07620 [Lysinibacillus antri]